MTNKHMNTCSTSLITRERQSKTTMRYHLTPVRIAITKNKTENKYQKGSEETGTMCNGGGDIRIWKKTVQRFVKKFK